MDIGNRIEILDTTLRDGGLGLEDAWKNKESDDEFSLQEKKDIVKALSKSNIEYIELGAIEHSKENKEGFNIYPKLESFSEFGNGGLNLLKKCAVFFRGPDIPLEEIPQWNEHLCKNVRMCLRYSELSKSLDYAYGLAKKNYNVFIQPMLTMRYSQDELLQVIKSSNDMGAYAVYFVDSYGCMMPGDVQKFYNVFDSFLNSDIKIGFHAHNNTNMAMANVLRFINISQNREIIIDSCIEGMGQGAGNLTTEEITFALNRDYKKSYNYSSILDVCELIDKHYINTPWGYSVSRLLGSLYKTAYKYSVAMRNQYHLKYQTMNELLKIMPENLRFRYTKENLEKIIKDFMM